MDFFVGQRVRGITPDKKEFQGFYRERLQESGKQAVVRAPSGLWIAADELFDLTPVGRNLREAAEETVKALVETFDPEQVKNMPDEDKEIITNVLIDQIGSDAKGNEDKVREILNTELCKKELENNSDSDSEVVKKYQDEEKKHLQESAGSQGYGIFDREYEILGTENYSSEIKNDLDENEFKQILQSLVDQTYDRVTLIDYIRENKAVSVEEAEQYLEDFLNSEQSLDAVSGGFEDDEIDQEVENFLNQPEYEDASINRIYEGLLEHFNCTHLRENLLDNGEVTKNTFDQLEHHVKYQRKLESSCSSKEFRKKFKKHLIEALGNLENVFVAHPLEVQGVISDTLEDTFSNKPIILSTEEGGIIENSEDLAAWTDEVSTDLLEDMLISPEEAEYQEKLNKVATSFLDSLGVYYK